MQKRTESATLAPFFNVKKDQKKDQIRDFSSLFNVKKDRIRDFSFLFLYSKNHVKRTESVTSAFFNIKRTESANLRLSFIMQKGTESVISAPFFNVKKDRIRDFGLFNVKEPNPRIWLLFYNVKRAESAISAPFF